MQWRPLLARTLASVFLAAAGAASAFALQPPSDAGASGLSYAGRVGLSSHLVWVSEAEARPQLERARAGGVEWIREDFLWGAIERTRGTYDWRHPDGLMAAAARSGINVLGVLTYSPAWASSDPSGAGDGAYPPADVGDYGRFAAAVVRRYGPGGIFWSSRSDLPARPLTAVELWNEPWGYWAWKPNPDPSAYARLARAGATAVKQANPQVKVLVVGDLLQARTDGKIVDFLANVLTADASLPTAFDAYAIHPYPHPWTLGPYDDRADQGYRWDYRRVAVAHQVAVARSAAKPFWITEIGWSTAMNAEGGVSEAVQASHVQGAVKRAIEEWGGFVERVFVYQWDRSNGNMADREGNFGLRRADDSDKPAWSALKSLVASGSPTSTGMTPTGTTPTTTTAPTTTTPPPTTTTTTPTPGNGHGRRKPKPKRGGDSSGGLTLTLSGDVSSQSSESSAVFVTNASTAQLSTSVLVAAAVQQETSAERAILRVEGNVSARDPHLRRDIRRAAEKRSRRIAILYETNTGWKTLARLATARNGRFAFRGAIVLPADKVVVRAVARYGTVVAGARVVAPSR